MKGKIAYYCSSESWGGLEMNHMREAKWMSDRGHEIIIFSIPNSPFYNNCTSEGLNVKGIEKQKKYYDFKKGRELVKQLTELGITHLVIRSTYDMSIAATVKFKLKSAITTLYCQEMQLGVKKTNFLHSLRFNYIDIWRTPLQSLAAQVNSWTKFKNKLVVIPSALDLSSLLINESKSECRQILKLPEDVLLLGLIGRFDPQKGQDLLLKAMSKTKNCNYHVVLLGEPTKNEGAAFYNSMQEMIENSDLKDRVHVRPFMKNPAIFYNAIDWLVMATKAETFGMVTIESIACGTPVIGSNAGGTPELLENETAGILFQTLDAESLGLRIDEIIDKNISFDPQKLKKKAEVYDHHIVCKSLEKAIGVD